MPDLLQEVFILCTDISSDKSTVRCKAAERFDQILTLSGKELVILLKQHSSSETSWDRIFQNAVEAVFKQANKIDELKDSKSVQTIRNKNYIFSGIVNKILDLNLDDKNFFLSKSAIFNAFTEGLRMRSTIKNFGLLLLNLLERGLYKSSFYVREIKVNEFSRILSHLFEINVDSDEILRFAILKLIIKTIELAHEHVQIHVDVIEYLPEIAVFAKYANNDRRKEDVVKLYHLYVLQLAVDYHYTICGEIQELIPKISEFYDVNLKSEMKALLFNSIYISLYTIYPQLNEGNFNSMNIKLKSNWVSCIKKLKTIVDVEANEMTLALCRVKSRSSDNNYNNFVEMSAAIMYTIHWHPEPEEADEMEPLKKKTKNCDTLEAFIDTFLPTHSKPNEVKFAIFAELIKNYNILSLTNVKYVVDLVSNIVNSYLSPSNFKQLRIIVQKLLQNESKLISSSCIKSDFFGQHWELIIENLLKDATTTPEIMGEKQVMFQLFIRHKKMGSKNCINLMRTITTSNSYKRTECLQTVREILLNANELNIDKSGSDVGNVIKWVIAINDKVNVSNVMQNIAPVGIELIADTCSIAIINFLSVQQEVFVNSKACKTNIINLKLLFYKYNKKLICLEEHAKATELSQIAATTNNSENKKNCLYQSNYELLMLLLNSDTIKGTTFADVALVLLTLHKMLVVMRKMIEYNVFSEHNFINCPLIKRIGLHLSHLELQLKSNNLKVINSDIHEILSSLLKIFESFTGNETLLKYIEKEPLDELIKFVGNILSLNGSKEMDADIESKNLFSSQCFKILSMLCASETHSAEAFAHIQKFTMCSSTEINILFDMIEILCRQKLFQQSIANWFVDKLKTVFKLYYTDINIVRKIISLLPGIFQYVYGFEDSLQNMLIALVSLLKIANKKSYSVNLTVKLIESVRSIATNCKTIFENENFKNVCISVVKFLSFPSLNIQFAALTTIIGLMDGTGSIVKNLSIYHSHLDFCNEIYAHINWKKLSSTDTNGPCVDVKQNNTVVTVQTLISIFAFSSYHQYSALQDLTYLCALRKLKQSDVSGFVDISSYFKRPLSDITKPFVHRILQKWFIKKYSIFKFPYFLLDDTRDTFILKNLKPITTCLMIHSDIDEIKKLSKYGSVEILIEEALPELGAYYLTYACDPRMRQHNEYHQHMEYLSQNLNSCGIDLLDHLKNNLCINWRIFIQCLENFQDGAHFKEMFGLEPLFGNDSEWYSIDFEMLKKTFSFYINHKYNCMKEGILTNVFKNEPVALVNCLNAMKSMVSLCTFTFDKLKYFYKLCTFIDIIINSLPKNLQTDNCEFSKYAKFFIRDAIFINLNFIKTGNSENILQLASIKFLEYILQKTLTLQGKQLDVLKSYFGDICNVLIDMIYKTTHSNCQEAGIKLLEKLIIDSEENFKDVIVVLDEVPKTDIFRNILEYQQQLLNSMDSSKKFASILQSFSKKRNVGLSGLQALRENLAIYKIEIRDYKVQMLDIVNILLSIVQSSDIKEIRDEAAKCLGEIGPLKINQTSFYFPVNYNCQSRVEEQMDPVIHFIDCILSLLDRRFLQIEPKNLEPVCQVILSCINSVHDEQFIDKYPLFAVFRSNGINESYLEAFKNVKDIEWVQCFKLAKAECYEGWVKSFMTNVFSQCDWVSLKNLSSVEFFFAEAILLPLINFLLTMDKNRHLNELCILLQYYFHQFILYLNKSPEVQLMDMQFIFKDKRIVKLFLNISESVRLNNDWCIPINYLNVSKACNFCQAYFMSIMYLELWASAELSSSNAKIGEIFANVGFQECAVQAYQSIGCKDAIYACLNPLTSRLEFLDLENSWGDFFLECESTKIQKNLYTSILKKNGMLSLASCQQDKENIDYEICWRLAQWDTKIEGLSKVNSLNDMEYEYSKHHFNSLKSIFNREENNALVALRNARDCILFILKEISVECLQSVYKYLTWLQFLQHVEDFCKVQFSVGNDIMNILHKWRRELDLQYNNFYFKEQIISHQIALYKTAGIRKYRNIKDMYNGDPVEECLVQCIYECKKAGEVNLAKRNIALLRNMDTKNETNRLIAFLEDAEVCFKSGKTQVTKEILQHILTNVDFLYCLERIRAVQMYGQYLIETNTEPFVVVSENYFFKSIEVFSKIKEKIRVKYPNRYSVEKEASLEIENKKGAYENIAKYADREYTQLNNYINSHEFQTKCRIIRENREAANSVGKQQKDRDRLVGAMNLKKFANLDEIDVQNVERKRSENLCISIEHYIRYCNIDESLSCSFIYRIIALWFANKQNENLHKIIVDNIYSISSYKFICALNQMTARLNSNSVDFLSVVKKLLLKCAQEHPHHTVYQLYPLIFALADNNIGNKNDSRINNAKEIVTAARNVNNSNCFKQMDSMFSALIDFANTAPPDNKTMCMTLSDKLKKLKSLDSIQCPTINLQVSPNMVYQITSIVKWDSKVVMVGGINAPKKLVCLCSDGLSRPQLLKGKDDLRQDAVMQQLFAMVNELLRNEQKAVNRNLILRTYKVTPLSMRSGILEWCQNTIPIGVYLTGRDGKGGAHKKYRPDDFTNLKCRQLSLSQLKSDIEKRYQVYNHICDNIKPVFQYFFLEKFKIPGVWFERRLAYTNSVATTSIVGFILGLGDRHTQNILIDEQSGELVHIDFGIAFEQGRIMPTPETVPFRLTRDIVAPMGVCGTKGSFTKSCEITMGILRLNQSIITTILEVLLYDPLYIWKVVAPTSSELEGDEQNLTAQRALFVVQDKLEGKQPGFLGTANIDVHVQRLINDAVSARNLCQLYPGWDPYL